MNLFRVRGIQLAVHSSFFLLLAYVGWKGWDEARLAGMAWNAATLVAFFTCVILHELGHSFTAMRFGIGVRRILLMPIGGMAEFDSIPRQPARELLITLAGPAVNFAIAAILWTWAKDISNDANPYSPQGFLDQLFVANLVMGCFNLLPAFPMDGGRIFRALMAIRIPYLRATRWAANVGKVVCIIGVIGALGAGQICSLIGIDGEGIGPLWLLALLFAFIFFAGEMEYRATERRELEDAHWRRMLEQIYQQNRPADEPPVLSP